jgi:hypothetical protein
MLCLSVQRISGCSRYILVDKFRSYRRYILAFGRGVRCFSSVLVILKDVCITVFLII